MSGFSEYDRYDALGLAELVRAGEVSARDLLDEAIARREAVNPKLNAIVHNMDEQAYAAIDAGLPEGLFQGVPFLLKDLLAAYKGVPMTSGSRAYANYVPDYDSELVSRFKKAGLVIFGKTNCPENGYVGATEPRLHGITRNPWNLQRTAGGSSGGSAAAVAARIVPMANGGDGGGSLRIPASACGLVGLKPSRGRVPFGPVLGDPWCGQVQEGVMSLSVRDSAAVLDAVAGPDIGGPYAIPAPTRPYLQELDSAPGKLRIAWTRRPMVRDGELGEECVSALLRTVQQLQELGHELVEVDPPTDAMLLGKGHILRTLCAAAVDVREAERNLGRRLKAGEFEPETWMMARLGESIAAPLMESVNQDLFRQQRLFECFMQDYDVLLTPTLSKPPVDHGEFLLKGVEKTVAHIAAHIGLGPVAKLALTQLPQQVRSKFDWVSATPAANITGNPSLSLPLQWSDDGLPIGMMFTARYLDEATLLRLASQLEQAQPWWDKRPPLCAGG